MIFAFNKTKNSLEATEDEAAVLSLQIALEKSIQLFSRGELDDWDELSLLCKVRSDEREEETTL